jgi:hypothetical protein
MALKLVLSGAEALLRQVQGLSDVLEVFAELLVHP